ncbi:MAG: helix-turn-helix domain-containing protein [Ruminococcus sp.]|nr:helix-turn-helix domain-containing protein [Ruminococcus sp.]
MNKPYYPTLEAKASEKGITKKSIAETLKVTQKTLSCKFSGKYDFGLREAKKIHDVFFPDIPFLELFRHE